MSRTNTTPMRTLNGHRPSTNGYSKVGSSDIETGKGIIEDESDEEEDGDLTGEASDETACQKFWLSIGVTWFLPVSYHEKERRRLLARMIRINRRYKKERQTDLENCILRAREASLTLESRRELLIKAFDRSGGKDDISLATLKTEIQSANTELMSRHKLVEVARAEFDNVCGILSHLEIEQRLSHGDKAEHLFNRFIKKGRNPNRVINEHQEIRARMSEFATNTQLRVDSRTTETELSNMNIMSTMNDTDKIIEECRSISAAKRKMVPAKSTNASSGILISTDNIEENHDS